MAWFNSGEAQIVHETCRVGESCCSCLLPARQHCGKYYGYYLASQFIIIILCLKEKLWVRTKHILSRNAGRLLLQAMHLIQEARNNSQFQAVTFWRSRLRQLLCQCSTFLLIYAGGCLCLTNQAKLDLCKADLDDLIMYYSQCYVTVTLTCCPIMRVISSVFSLCCICILANESALQAYS